MPGAEPGPLRCASSIGDARERSRLGGYSGAPSGPWGRSSVAWKVGRCIPRAVLLRNPPPPVDAQPSRRLHADGLPVIQPDTAGSGSGTTQVHVAVPPRPGPGAGAVLPHRLHPRPPQSPPRDPEGAGRRPAPPQLPQ